MKTFFFQSAVVMVSLSISGIATAANHGASHGAAPSMNSNKVSTGSGFHSQPSSTSFVSKTPFNGSGFNSSSFGSKNSSGFSGNHMNGPNLQASYVKTYGKSFGQGICYPGQNHSHWTYSCYSPKYGCSCYWCPYTCGYYYWCQSATCYYPVSCYPCPQPVCTEPAYCPPCTQPICSPPCTQTVQVQTQTQTQSQFQTQGPIGVQGTASLSNRPLGVPPVPQ